MAKWKKTIDMAIASHLDAHVMGASSYLTVTILGPLTLILLVGGYEFLMEQCSFFENVVTEIAWRCSSRFLDHVEDKICIFGFSRGAYTARALAGMIHKVSFSCCHICGSNHDLLGRRLVYFRQVTTNRFPSRTRCSLVMTKRVGLRATHSRRLLR